MVLPVLIIWLSLLADRVAGDPPNRYHPVAWLGRFIGWWGRPAVYPEKTRRFVGFFMGILTAVLFSLPFFILDLYLPVWAAIVVAPFLLKICLAWRCLEEHVASVEKALSQEGGGRSEVGMLVSRDPDSLSEEEVLSAAYESMSENLTDSIVSPLFYYSLFGLGGAAFFRASNTMDAMLGYRDERIKIGWFPARLDDLLNFIPARLAGLSLVIWFAAKGSLGDAWAVLKRDRKKRAGPNGGVTMSLIAGGCGIAFIKPGVYVIGDKKRSLIEAGADIRDAVRAATIISAIILSLVLLAAGGIVFRFLLCL
ncbi:adenosylcobinamide-phosphate synthase CbiB [Methanolacinia paynteri]|uniref:adenosylcobinamide-phosphate synthase CbiB n=1 Tax=Methanolacinia paynteri TaxID=230356 RepID=UPI00064FF4C6|nr:adenosylcobinamide-phosphate synthase CbiB [Methanolacinia paynteri]